MSVEDAVAVTVAGLIYSEASTKWPDLYSDIYHRAAKERSDQAELVERMNQTPVQ